MKTRERERERNCSFIYEKKILLTYENNLFHLFHWVLIINHHFYIKQILMFMIDTEIERLSSSSGSMSATLRPYIWSRTFGFTAKTAGGGG